MSATLAPAAGRSRCRSQRLTGPRVLAAAALTVSVLLHVRDPHRSGSWGCCPWFLATGTYCPGCGGLRAVNDLTNGDLGALGFLALALGFSVLRNTAAGAWLAP